MFIFFFSSLALSYFISINFQPFCFIYVVYPVQSIEMNGFTFYYDIFWQDDNLIYVITNWSCYIFFQRYDRNRRLHTQFLFHMLEAKYFFLFIYKNGFCTPEYTNLPLEIDHSIKTANKNVFKQIQFYFCAFFCFAYKTNHNSFDFRTVTSHRRGVDQKKKKKRNTTKTLKHDRLFFSTTIKGNKCFLMTEITYKIKFIKATIRWRYFSTNAEMPKTTFFRCLHEPFQTDVGNRKRKKLSNKKYLCEKRVETAMKKKFKEKTKAKFEKWKFNAFPSLKNVKIRRTKFEIWKYFDVDCHRVIQLICWVY